MYIKLPMYLFYYMGLDDMISMRGNPYLGPWEGVGSGNLDFFGPKMRYGFPRIEIISSRPI